MGKSIIWFDAMEEEIFDPQWILNNMKIDVRSEAAKCPIIGPECWVVGPKGADELDHSLYRIDSTRLLRNIYIILKTT